MGLRKYKPLHLNLSLIIQTIGWMNNSMDKDKIFDSLLVMDIIKGKKHAFELLVKRWNKKLMLYAFRICQNKENSKDIAQEAWFDIVKGIHKLKNKEKVGSWMLSIVHNKSIDLINQQKKRKKIEFNVEQESDNGDQEVDIRSAIKNLSVDHKSILSLFYLEGLTIREISSIMNIAPGTIKSRLFYARESLKTILKNKKDERERTR